MNEHNDEHRQYSLAIGLAAGAAIGVGLALWFAPRLASELRHRVGTSARQLGERASEQYRQASTCVSETVDDLARQGQAIRNDAAEVVARGAREVERVAVAVKS